MEILEITMSYYIDNAMQWMDRRLLGLNIQIYIYSSQFPFIHNKYHLHYREKMIKSNHLTLLYVFSLLNIGGYRAVLQIRDPI